jgi:multiple sugar transport system permease protein
MEQATSLYSEFVREKSRKRLNKKLITGLLFTSPVLLGYAIFIIIPLILTIILSFTNYSIGAKSTVSVGLSNYTDMFMGRDIFFYPSIKATAYYVLFSVPLGITFSFLVAVLLNRNIKGRGLFRSIFYLPVVIPLASSAIIWMWMLQPDFGVINFLLREVGLPTSPWLSSDTTAMPTLILFSFWLCGSTIVIFLAGLQGIPSHLYEAIEVDGGNAWHKLIYITIPMSSPIIFFNTVIGFINGLQTFVQPSVMTNGGPSNSTMLYVIYVFQNGFKFSKMGAASASAMILFVISILFTYLLFRLSRSWIHYEGDGKRS